MSNKKLYKITKIDTTSVPCEVSIEVILSKESITQHEKKALESLNTQVHIDGFRAGHVPEKVLVEKVGAYAVTEESIRSAVDTMFGEIVMESKEMPVNQPQIIITKMAVGEDAEFKIVFATPPTIELGDYKKIAKKHNTDKIKKENNVEATEEELNTMLLNLQKELAHANYHKHHDHADHSHGDLEPIPLSDEFAQQIGPFKTLNELKDAIKTNISESKTQKALEDYRIALVDDIIANTKISYPNFFLVSEQGIMIEELKGHVARSGGAWIEYLKNIGKSEEQLKEERKGTADIRVKTQLVLSKIGVTENIKPDENIVVEQIKDIKKTHPEAIEDNVRAFVERFELNQLVWKFLEALN